MKKKQVIKTPIHVIRKSITMFALPRDVYSGAYNSNDDADDDADDNDEVDNAAADTNGDNTGDGASECKCVESKTINVLVNKYGDKAVLSRISETANFLRTASILEQDMPGWWDLIRGKAAHSLGRLLTWPTRKGSELMQRGRAAVGHDPYADDEYVRRGSQAEPSTALVVRKKPRSAKTVRFTSDPSGALTGAAPVDKPVDKPVDEPEPPTTDPTPTPSARTSKKELPSEPRLPGSPPPRTLKKATGITTSGAVPLSVRVASRLYGKDSPEAKSALASAKLARSEALRSRAARSLAARRREIATTSAVDRSKTQSYPGGVAFARSKAEREGVVSTEPSMPSTIDIEKLRKLQQSPISILRRGESRKSPKTSRAIAKLKSTIKPDMPATTKMMSAFAAKPKQPANIKQSANVLRTVREIISKAEQKLKDSPKVVRRSGQVTWKRQA